MFIFSNFTTFLGSFVSALPLVYGLCLTLLMPMLSLAAPLLSGLRSLSALLRSHLSPLVSSVIKSLTHGVLHSSRVLPDYYRMSGHIWQEGLLIDWLQKKVFDKWVRRFLVHSSYLVSERVIFDLFVRFYIDYVIWPTHRVSIFDFRSIASVLTFLLVSIAALVLVVNVLILAGAVL
jgi:hypothetical protein